MQEKKYVANFSINTFNGVMAHMEEFFRVVGTDRIRVKEEKGKFWSSPFETKMCFTAKSSKPFVVVILTVASGDDQHLDGGVNVIRAVQENN